MIVVKPHSECVNVVACHPDGDVLASVSQDGWVKAWNPATLHAETPTWAVDAETGDVEANDAEEDDWFIFTLENFSGVSHAQFTPDGKSLVTSGWSRHLRAWDARTGEPQWQVRKSRGIGGVGTLVISRDGSHVAFAGGAIGINEKIDVLDLKTLEIVRTLRGHDDACGALAAGPDGFASGGADKHVRFWSWDTRRCYHDLGLRGVVRGIGFSPAGTHFAASGGSVIMVWDMDLPPRSRGRRKPGRVRHFRGHTDQVQSLEFSPDGNTIASAAHDGTLRIWDVATGGEVRAFAPKVGQLHAVAFAPDGLTLAFGSERGHVGILDVGE